MAGDLDGDREHPGLLYADVARIAVMVRAMQGIS